MSQEHGMIGKVVGAMIRRSVRSRFHSVHWTPIGSPSAPAVFYANHHGWMDGYLMFHVVTKLGIRCLDWIEEFDAFPLFSRIGGMRFDKSNPGQRAGTIRKTIREMREGASLVVFPEGKLHRPPDVLPFGRAIETIAKNVPHVAFVPVGLLYEQSLHERPEAWIAMGASHDFESVEDCRDRVLFQLSRARESRDEGFALLVAGTPDINERRRLPGRRPS